MGLPRYELILNRHSKDSPWGYAELDQAQRERKARSLDATPQPGAVFLSEVAPVITLGRRDSSQDLLFRSKPFWSAE